MSGHITSIDRIKAFRLQHSKAMQPNGIAVHGALMLFTNQEDRCWPSHETLAELCGMCRQTVIKTLDHLEKKGFISIERRTDGGKQSNVYTLLKTSKSDVNPVYIAKVKKSDVNALKSDVNDTNIGGKSHDQGDVNAVNNDVNSINIEGRSDVNVSRLADGDRCKHPLHELKYLASPKEKETLRISNEEDAKSEEVSGVSSFKEKGNPNKLPIIRTKPQDLNTPRDPLWDALHKICQGSGTGNEKFVSVLKELNAAKLYCCDLDEIAEMIRQERPDLPRLHPGHFLLYIPFYISKKEREDDEERKYQKWAADCDRLYLSDLPTPEEQTRKEADRKAKAESDRLRKEAEMLDSDIQLAERQRLNMAFVNMTEQEIARHFPDPKVPLGDHQLLQIMQAKIREGGSPNLPVGFGS